MSVDKLAPLVLRRAVQADAAQLAALSSDPAVFAGLLQLPYTSPDQWQQRLREPPTAGSNAELLLLAERDGALLGMGGLHPLPHVRRRHAAGIGMWVAAHAQGQGIGTALMAALCDYADNWAHLLRLELTVYTDNQRALALYQRHGFVIEGTHRGFALRQGQYADVYAMARWHPAPPVLRPAAPS